MHRATTGKIGTFQQRKINWICVLTSTPGFSLEWCQASVSRCWLSPSSKTEQMEQGSKAGSWSQMKTYLSPISKQGSFLPLPSPLLVPWISEYVHLNIAARREPWHIRFMSCTMCCCSWGTAGKNEVCFPPLPPATLGKSIHHSDVVSHQCNRNNPLFLGRVVYQRLWDGLILILLGHVDEVGSTICASVCALHVSGRCHSSSFYKMSTTSTFVKITLACIHANYSQKLVK